MNECLEHISIPTQGILDDDGSVCGDRGQFGATRAPGCAIKNLSVRPDGVALLEDKIMELSPDSGSGDIRVEDGLAT